MFCNNCGMKLDDDALFCPNCGTRVSAIPQTVDDEEKTVLLVEEVNETNQSTEDADVEASEEPAEVQETVQEEQTVETAQEKQAVEPVPETEMEQTEEQKPIVEKVEAVEILPTGMVETTGTTLVQAVHIEQKKFCPNCGSENGVNDLFCHACGMPFVNADQAFQGTEQKKPKKNMSKKSMLKIIVPIAAVAAVAVIALGIVIVPRVLGFLGINVNLGILGNRGNQKEYLLYIKDNELNMVDGSRFEPLLIDDKYYKDKDSGSNTYMRSDLFFNGYYYAGCMFDNKYIYYIQNIDSDDGTCDLYRKKLSDKKAEAEKIDSNIVGYYLIIDNDKILYFKGIDDQRLYIYNKGETNKVASDVSPWTIMLSEDKKNVIWRTNDGNMYVQDTDLKADKVKLDSDVSEVYAHSDNLDVIVYKKDDNLYLLRDLEDKEKIASDVEEVYVYGINNNLQIYYMKEGDEEEMSVYDFIEDDYLATDENMVEPRIEDFQTVTYVNDWFGTREKIETSDSYYDALDEYDQKLKRDDLRYNMQNITMSIVTEMVIYHYDFGNDESDKVMEASVVDYGDLGTDTALMYLWTVDLEELERPTLSRLMEDEYTRAWEERLGSSMAERMRLQYIKNGEVFEVSDLGIDREELSEAYGIYMYTLESDGSSKSYDEGKLEAYLYANEQTHTMYLAYELWDNNELYSFDYNVSDSDAQMVSDEVGWFVQACDEGIYYINEDDELYCNQTKIDSDVDASSVRCEDGKVLYLTDINKDHDEGTLKLYQGDKAVKIADDVAISRYRFFDGNKVVFMSDYNFNKYRGDLSVYDGKEVIKVDSDVQLVFFCH